MTKAERMLREKITEVRAWDNEPFKRLDNILNHAIIPYKDALKAVEEALAEEPNWEVSNLTDINKWDLSNVNNHAVKEDATIKAKPKPIRLKNGGIDRKKCTVLRFKVKGGGKLDDWWTHELVCSYENIFIHYILDEKSTSSIQLKPYLLSKEEAYAIINEWKNELG